MKAKFTSIAVVSCVVLGGVVAYWLWFGGKPDIASIHYWNDVSHQDLQQDIADGADIAATDNYGNTALHHAVLYGTPDHVTALLDAGANTNARTHSGQTPLSLSPGSHFDLQETQLLLDNGADTNVADQYGTTPLHQAAYSCGSRGAMFELLLANGAQINSRENDGDTPLHIAAQVPCPATSLAFLISAGADVNAQNERGTTALWLHTTFHGEAAGIDVLLEAGADTHLKDVEGKTICDTADPPERAARSALADECGWN